jgi:hypothetical protein
MKRRFVNLRGETLTVHKETLAGTQPDGMALLVRRIGRTRDGAGRTFESWWVQFPGQTGFARRLVELPGTERAADAR